ILDVNSIAKGAGSINSSRSDCECNRTVCGGTDGCESRCAGCDSRFHSACVPITDPDHTAVRAVVGTAWSFAGCHAGCGECGWCLDPGWPDGCGGFCSQQVTLQNCRCGDVGWCYQTFGQNLVCGGRCGITPACTESLCLANVWDELDACAASYG